MEMVLPCCYYRVTEPACTAGARAATATSQKSTNRPCVSREREGEKGIGGEGGRTEGVRREAL